MTDIFEMQKEFDELMKKGQELIKKMKENQSEKVERWKPKNDDVFYYVADNGRVMLLKVDDYVSDFVENLYDFHNCFKTEQEAQKELDRRIAEQELLDMCDWEDGACAEIMYDLEDKKFSVGFPCTENCYSPYRFATKESAKKTIDTIGEDKLKLIFRID